MGNGLLKNFKNNALKGAREKNGNKLKHQVGTKPYSLNRVRGTVLLGRERDRKRERKRRKEKNALNQKQATLLLFDKFDTHS